MAICFDVCCFVYHSDLLEMRDELHILHTKYRIHYRICSFDKDAISTVIHTLCS